jgi:hypothetical protein
VSRPRATCLACGYEGNAPTSERDRTAEVSMTVVEYPDPIEVDVASVREFKEPERHGYAQPLIEYHTVAGRYGAETRCTDVAACADRIALATPTKPAVPSLEDWFA